MSGLALVMLCGLVFFFSSAGNSQDMVVVSGDERPAQSKVPVLRKGGVYVHVCGEVKKPGVYVFSAEPRVVEAVERAGGFTKKADRDCINQAETLADGMQLFISPKAKKTGKTAQKPETGRTDKVNINTASKKELMTLSGIGESKASQILSYREEAGKFQKIEDIMNISGIKEGVFGKIKDKITV